MHLAPAVLFLVEQDPRVRSEFAQGEDTERECAARVVYIEVDKALLALSFGAWFGFAVVSEGDDDRFASP